MCSLCRHAGPWGGECGGRHLVVATRWHPCAVWTRCAILIVAPTTGEPNSSKEMCVSLLMTPRQLCVRKVKAYAALLMRKHTNTLVTNVHDHRELQ